MTTSLLTDRDHLRLCQVRATTEAAVVGTGDDTSPLPNSLDFGRLQPQLDSAGVLVPRVLGYPFRPLDRVLKGQKLDREVSIRWRSFAVRTFTGQVVEVRMISTPFESIDVTTKLLEDLYYEQFELDRHADGWNGRGGIDQSSLVRPFHQLIFVPDNESEPSWEAIHQLIYRIEMEAIEEQSSIIEPQEINRRPGQLAAVSRFGSVMWQVQDYIETSAILSAIVTVGALSSIRDAHLSAADLYLSSVGSGTQADAEGSLKHLARLDAEIAHGAEGFASISPLVQSLRAESFHRSLYEAAGVIEQARTASRMLSSLRELTVGW